MDELMGGCVDGGYWLVDSLVELMMLGEVHG